MDEIFSKDNTFGSLQRIVFNKVFNKIAFVKNCEKHYNPFYGYASSFWRYDGDIGRKTHKAENMARRKKYHILKNQVLKTISKR